MSLLGPCHLVIFIIFLRHNWLAHSTLLGNNHRTNICYYTWYNNIGNNYRIKCTKPLCLNTWYNTILGPFVRRLLPTRVVFRSFIITWVSRPLDSWFPDHGFLRFIFSFAIKFFYFYSCFFLSFIIGFRELTHRFLSSTLDLNRPVHP